MKADRVARFVAVGLAAGFFAAVPLIAATLPATAVNAVEAADENEAIAIRLAEMLRSARTVISRNQTLINDATVGDKGLTGDRVLAEAITLYREKIGEDPAATGADTREGTLLSALMDSIVAVMNENQPAINAVDVGFKGFIPAVFARLVNERFVAQVGDIAQMKVTAPQYLVRNRKARPDTWESVVIADRFGSADWPRGKPYSEQIEVGGRPAFRLLEPEYYAASCLSCHGEPAGETDITGYPKEGGHEGDLGAAISIVLFK